MQWICYPSLNISATLMIFACCMSWSNGFGSGERGKKSRLRININKAKVSSLTGHYIFIKVTIHDQYRLSGLSEKSAVYRRPERGWDVAGDRMNKRFGQQARWDGNKENQCVCVLMLDVDVDV